MKKLFLLSLLFSALLLQALDTQVPQKSFYEKIKDRERELAVPRDTVPVEDNRFLIDSPIPKTAHYLPFLQTLLNIEVGSLPNPIGVSFIGSHTEERYKVTKFNAQTGKTLVNLPLGIGKLFNPKQHEWKLSEGIVEAKTSALGIKADMFIFPFMQVFATAAYLHMEQTTRVGTATIPFVKPASLFQQASIDSALSLACILNPKLCGGKSTKNNMTVPVGTISNSLDGWMAMAGTNLAIGYKGFFASFMISGGYVQLDDNANGVTGFVQKPFMYMAPRIGYSYHGIATIHFGVQRIELFGATEGKDLSASTGGLVAGYSVEVEKFPVNFLAGLQLNFARDLGLSVEYVGSPDTNGINAEIAFRF